MNFDSIVEYVRWLDRRHNSLREAVKTHRMMKTTMAIHGSIDGFDRELWKAMELSYQGEDDE
jgi:hypothetical protein